MRNHFLAAAALIALPALAAEKTFDFGETRENEPPAGFRSAVVGLGKPGDWRILFDDVPPLLPPLTPQAPVVAKKAVLAQIAQDPTDEHFPLLIFEGDSFDDFTLTTRFKTMRGVMEQMAGLAFRIQNETNFYVVRASSLGNTFRFYKVVNGERGPPVGPDVPIPAGAWHELGIECKGNQIRALLDGKERINLTDKVSPFMTGKIGFWTKSDSVSYFADTRIVYTRRELVSQTVVREMVKKYPRLLGLEIYALGGNPKVPHLVASKEEKDVGKLGGKTEQDVIARGTTYYGKDRNSVSVTMPLRDRNGEAIAAALVVMKTFAGQTQENALERALPIVKDIQGRIQSLQELDQPQ